MSGAAVNAVLPSRRIPRPGTHHETDVGELGFCDALFATVQKRYHQPAMALEVGASSELWPVAVTMARAVGGSFAAAWLCEQRGRDPGWGGALGLVGGLAGWGFLLSLFAWILSNPTRIVVKGRRRRWYRWFWPTD